jgi:hypothetical protein
MSEMSLHSLTGLFQVDDRGVAVTDRASKKEEAAVAAEP